MDAELCFMLDESVSFINRNNCYKKRSTVNFLKLVPLKNIRIPSIFTFFFLQKNQGQYN